MIDQFYTVVDQNDQYMYRSNDIWRGTNFPRATGCAGTVDKAERIRDKIMDWRDREVAQRESQHQAWMTRSSVAASRFLSVEEMDERHNKSQEERRARTYHVVKITVEKV